MRGPLEARGGRLVPKAAARRHAASCAWCRWASSQRRTRPCCGAGLVLNKAVQQFIEDADWSGIDYLLVDLPPGTSDVPMGLARTLPQTGLLLVTTPPLAAQLVAARAGDLARRANLRVARRDREHELVRLRARDDLRRCSAPAAASGSPPSSASSCSRRCRSTPSLGADADEGRPVALTDRPAGRRASRSSRGAWSTSSHRRPGAQGCTARLLDAMERAAPALARAAVVRCQSVPGLECAACTTAAVGELAASRRRGDPTRPTRAPPPGGSPRCGSAPRSVQAVRRGAAAAPWRSARGAPPRARATDSCVCHHVRSSCVATAPRSTTTAVNTASGSARGAVEAAAPSSTSASRCAQHVAVATSSRSGPTSA